MLCLSRKEGEAVQAGNVTILVKRIKGNRVTLAIDAPKEVRIERTQNKGSDNARSI